MCLKVSLTFFSFHVIVYIVRVDGKLRHMSICPTVHGSMHPSSLLTYTNFVLDMC